MAHYRVFYSFTCPQCEHKNAMRDTLVSAQDRDTAVQMVHRQMKCLKCGELIPA
jgi:transcription elongation factor Elf1